MHPPFNKTLTVALALSLLWISPLSPVRAGEKAPEIPFVSFGPFPLTHVRTEISAAVGTPVSKAEMNVPYPDDFPPRVEINLRDERPYPSVAGGKAIYFFPGYNLLRVYDITEVIQAPYLTIQYHIQTLQQLLKDRPAFSKITKILPDYPPRNAAHCFEVKCRYVDAAWGSGICYVTQFSQDGSSPANNEELTYLFQGISKDGTRYLSADFRITHPKLARSVREAAFEEHNKGSYERDSALLLKQTDESFTPSLAAIRKWLESIRLKAE